MATGQLKHIHIIVLVGVSVLIPPFAAYPFCVELSGFPFFPSDMSYDDPGDEVLSTCQDESTVLASLASFDLLPTLTPLSGRSRIISAHFIWPIQNTCVLRC